MKYSLTEKGTNEITWSKKEIMQISIEDDGTARATTWERYYATDVKLPTIAAEGVFFDEEQTKAVNTLVSTSIAQALTEERERVVGIINEPMNFGSKTSETVRDEIVKIINHERQRISSSLSPKSSEKAEEIKNKE